MQTTLKRLFSLLLVMVLVLGMVPSAFAAELTETTAPEETGDMTTPVEAESEENTMPQAETTDQEETTTETQPSTEETEPTAITNATDAMDPDTTGPATDPTEATAPATVPVEETQPETIPEVLEEPDSLELLAEDGIMLASSTTGNVTLFDQASPDYTVRLSSQISVTYRPNGTGSAVTAYHKNLGWHFARYGGVSYPNNPIYCIEPHKEYAASTPGNYVDHGVTVDGSGGGRGSDVWYALPADHREAITLILLYSNQMWDDSYNVLTTPRASNPNVPLKVATQFLIYEIVTGLRDASTFQSNSSNGYTDGDVFYNAGVANVDNFAPNYNAIVNSVQAAMKIPSFTSKDRNSAPTITLTGDETSVYDSNGVLSNFSFTDGSGAEFCKSGNSLYITQAGTISPTTVFSCSRNLPSAKDSSVSIWYGGTSKYQACVSLYSPSSGSLNAYFKLKAPAKGNISLTKTTEDGKNLSGWSFGVYSNSACTALVSGPHTTNSSGKISITDLPAGTYYVKELGHTDSSIHALYTCASTNPQRVTVTSGGTATVSFYNKLNTGNAKLIKATNTGENVSGWKIGLYSDSGCTSQVSGSPFTTGSDGTVTVSGLKPGTYYAKEVGSADSYWACDTEIKAVRVEVNKTASVTFTNTHYGRIEFHKTTNTGNHLGGWTFQVRDTEGNVVGDYATDETGYACTENLLPGRYTVQELPTDDLYWTVELGFHTVTVEGGRNAVDKWHNKEQGLGWFYKKTNTGENVEGWHITVYSDEGCTQEVCSVTTNSEGKVGYYLDPGTYWAKETGDEHGRFENEYWMVDETVQQFEIKPHENTKITFTNVQYGKLQIRKTMDTDGSVEGWRFKITNVSGVEIEGSPFTMDKNGVILTKNLLPGTFTVEELIPEDSLFYCKSQNPQTVTVTQGQTAEVSFVNALRPGKVTVNKVDITGSPLAGATFLLEWSEDGALWYPVKYADAMVKGGCSNPNLVDGCLTTGADGVLELGNLYPGLQYRLMETKAPDGYNLLQSPAFEGELPVDDLTVEVRVTNVRTFTMPKTGASSGMILRIMSLVSGLVCFSLLIVHCRKRKV